MTWVDNQPAVGGTPFAVIGIVDDVERRADTLLGAMIPGGTARVVRGAARSEPADALRR
ncbi:hypothetical protein [Paractinoplanes brasiliensis]|uniref:hypothetical protein n=1 Tax=Paractinoplanes brasiliensis TaxID=52695 RepID=UPI001415191C|nr:hypothetical protein [Actinoplanes brasiliensis]GID27705.1 hypothetical protein Abr02nite_26880 [Actinoplanes brasiliensis]